MRFFKVCFYGACVLILSQCATKFLRYDKAEDLKEIKEFEQAVKIEPDPGAPTVSDGVVPEGSQPPATPAKEPLTTVSESDKSTSPKPAKRKKPFKSPRAESKNKQEIKPTPEIKSQTKERRQPELESEVGFVGRRPLLDPFRVGEKVVHSVNYFKMRAGYLNLETKPFSQVNGRKSYQFEISIRTSDFFSSFYSVDDKVVTWMDFETLVPSVFQLHVRESAQIREARSLFDFEKKTATFWERKVTDKDGESNKKLEWEILDYSQNVYSAAFYLRVFQWKVGSENAFRVANDSENLIFRGRAVRKEKLETEAGTFDAIVIKPEIELKGQFKPVGDIFIWLSDDERKFILRIESKIRIGTLVSEIIELHPGRD